MSPRPAAPSRASVNGVQHHVGVAVADQAARMLDAHAAEDQRPVRAKPMRVVTDADAEHGCVLQKLAEFLFGQAGRARQCRRA